MLDIKLTEEILEARINEVLSSPNIEPFKLRVYPGSLLDLSKVIQAHHVVLQFKSIEFDKAAGNRYGNCHVTQSNKVNFNILIECNNLRSHRDMYGIAQAIIDSLKGTLILQKTDGGVLECGSPCEILSYSFNKIENGGACYQSSISLQASYVDTYSAQTI